MTNHILDNLYENYKYFSMKKQKHIGLSVVTILFMIQPITVYLFSKDKKEPVSKPEDVTVSTQSLSFEDSIFSGVKSPNELNMNYYKKIRDTKNYIKYAACFCNNQLMRVSLDTIKQRDRLLAKSFKLTAQLIAISEKLDSLRLANLLEASQHLHKNYISQTLNDIAWDVFERVSDKDTLQYALRWSDRSLELSPKNPFFLDTNANLLYKLEKKERAIEKEEEALRYADKKSFDVFEETLRKMKSGEKTWKEKNEPIGSDVLYVR